jgi:radical SAM superfamily enzyme YgiQ (UPF0313 family)
MKRISLIAINARFSHSSLALLCLKHAAYEPDAIHLSEYNINDSAAEIAADIIAGSPDMAGFSCYIWNIEHVIKVASVVKKVLPDCLILHGGPEVSFDCATLMESWPFADIIIRGAGERPFAHLTQCLAHGRSIHTTPSACIRTSQGITETPDAPPYDFASQPFLYDDLSAFENRMIYYETSRGCPFRCAYCMSAGDDLSFLPLDRVRRELEHFMRANVRQVKLVDRTFNFPDDRAREIFAVLIALKEKYPHGAANFHFEISASLLSDATIALLATAPKGLIQLEIGIQSTNDDTLQAVSRAHDTQKLLRHTAALCRPQNLRVYVDLIAGLPMETMTSFGRSFDDAYSIGADRIQLGFLKLLKGSHMRKNAAQYGIQFTDHAPYEVLKTDTMTYQELRRLHRIEHVLDMLYNERQTLKTLDLLIPVFGSPYAFFDRFTQHLEDASYFARPQKRQAIFEQLFSFARFHMNQDVLREALCYDWLCLQRLGPWPDGIKMETENLREFFADDHRIKANFEQPLSIREIERRCVLLPFNHLFDTPALLLFDYAKDREDAGFIRELSRKNKERRFKAPPKNI